MGNEVEMRKSFPTRRFSIPTSLNLLGDGMENGDEILMGWKMK